MGLLILIDCSSSVLIYRINRTELLFAGGFRIYISIGIFYPRCLRKRVRSYHCIVSHSWQIAYCWRAEFTIMIMTVVCNYAVVVITSPRYIRNVRANKHSELCQFRWQCVLLLCRARAHAWEIRLLFRDGFRRNLNNLPRVINVLAMFSCAPFSLTLIAILLSCVYSRDRSIGRLYINLD